MKRCLIFLLFLIILSGVYASCEDGQIDINGASKEEMMKIISLGGEGIIAQRVIDARPFESIDDLINVKGIGENTLNKIKEQGLACIEDKEKNIEKNENDEEDKIIEKDEIEDEKEPEIIEEQIKKVENMKLSTINLDGKNIKSENNKESLGTNYVKQGFVIFCALIGFLFLLSKRKYRTEFD